MAHFGPLVVGALSDLLQPAAGISSLRYAMLLVPVAVVNVGGFAVEGYRRRASSP